jgi:hypothetical protein
MKANELRIGNYVHGNPYDGVIKIFNNGKCVIKHKSGIEKCEIKNLQPIPITEEWLLKFGFYKTMSWTYEIELEGNLKLVYYLGEKGWSIGFKSYSDFANLKYVHQLQNLYFALMGKELIYKNNL